MMVASSLLEVGARALAAGAWAEAIDAFEAACREQPSPEALDGLGRALWWSKRITEGIHARQRAYVGFREAGRWDQAAAIAAWLAREYAIRFRNDGAADGWLARAERAFERGADPRRRGWILIVRAERSTVPREAVELAREALSLARITDDADLEITALSRLGLLQIAVGNVDAGVGELDEAMAAATAGEGRDPQSVGEACCALMEAAQLIGDGDRFTRWGQAIDELTAGYDFGPLTAFGAASIHGTLSAFCGACCGGVFLVTGRLDEAEQELIADVAALESAGMYSRCVHPITQLAELRIVQGRFEEARAMLLGYEDLPESVRPLAILDLAEGQPGAAAERLRTRIEALSGCEILALPLWLLLVDADVASGDEQAAAEDASEVARLASLTGSRRHAGEAIFAAGKVVAARRDPEAPGLLREAARLLSESSLPLLACRARMELARCLCEINPPVSIAEARGALAAFERMGATFDADQAASFLRGMGVKGRTGPKGLELLSKREVEVLRLVAAGFSNAEISDRLFISVKTAGHHVSNILSKLGMRSRTEAAAYAALHLGREQPTRK
jgi:DNA-binding CsgD family transcriptional regulator